MVLKIYFKKYVLYIDIDSCVTRNYTTYYPSHTACTFYASDSPVEPRYTIPTPQTNVRKVFDFEIPMPTLPNKAHGDPIPLTIKVKKKIVAFDFY